MRSSQSPQVIKYRIVLKNAHLHKQFLSCIRCWLLWLVLTAEVAFLRRLTAREGHFVRTARLLQFAQNIWGHFSKIAHNMMISKNRKIRSAKMFRGLSQPGCGWVVRARLGPPQVQPSPPTRHHGTPTSCVGTWDPPETCLLLHLGLALLFAPEQLDC